MHPPIVRRLSINVAHRLLVIPGENCHLKVEVPALYVVTQDFLVLPAKDHRATIYCSVLPDGWVQLRLLSSSVDHAQHPNTNNACIFI